MAADDREILREVWQGRLPICFSLAEDEEDSLDKQEPCFLLVSRLTYITLVTEKLQKHFMKTQELKEEEEVWHYPVGVLFDLLAHGKPLPWNIKVHFKNFPEDELLHCLKKEVIEAHFMSSIKEADVLKHRGQVINNMQKRDHKQLWSGLQNGNLSQCNYEELLPQQFTQLVVTSQLNILRQAINALTTITVDCGRHYVESRRPLVVRTLTDCAEKLVTTEEDKRQELNHGKSALRANGYTPWIMKAPKPKKKPSKEQPGEKGPNISVPLPYVKGVSEKLANTFGDHGVNKFDQFWTINRRLMERTNEEPFRSVPLRIYQPDTMYIQRLCKAVADTGEPLNLGHVLGNILPKKFDNSESSSHQALIHGVEVPMETPVQWLSEHLSHPDNFLHIVVLKKKSEET
ncbi:Autophagy protein 5 [Holothuria leucospilota]|uniref:Autophagy protein 5 n=1 Tax=Holothuria leucospilota TaxID=206669 RepID=A0A9Q0YQ71_HOLLE|nr:Autophagy protein 5 [Holothuria leucospilota]